MYAPTTGTVVVNRVTDPYSIALTTNSQRSVLANLDHPTLKPAGWNRLTKPALPKPEYSSIYELHVRDFSISDETVPARHRGTYLAFTHRRSDGMRHLRQLARSGLNTVHLLSGTTTSPRSRSAVPSRRSRLAIWPRCRPTVWEQQECVAAVAERDGFNWGYDPLHYTTPEGSYATNPEGAARTRQFRRMVQGLNGAGLRAVIDVVYNHTPASGQDPKSILDRVVPGYYQRLTPTTGAVETSTCCSNTATEHAMMEKLMIDSVVTWARQYKLDGFRFDLMGHQPKSAMENLRRALNRLTLAKDGVDGRRIYLYGEAGTSARWPTTPASSRPPSWRWPAPALAPSTIGSATPFGAVGRSMKTHESRVSPAASTRPERRPSTGLRASRRPRCCQPGPDQGRVDRKPAGLPLRRPHRSDGDRS